MALVIISGGTGMIGTALSRELVTRGHRVVVLSRDPSRQPEYGESAIWDGIHPGIWMDWIKQADWIINLAGENIGAKPWTEDRWKKIRESRVFTGELLAESVLRASKKPSVFLQMSAIGFYGIQSKDDTTAWDESTPAGNDRLAQLCQEWESSSKGVEAMGTRHLIIRAGLVLDKKMGVLPRLRLPYKFFVGGPVGSGKQIYSWIHLDDLIQGMMTLLETPDTRGAYNLTAPEPVSNAEFGSILAGVIHRPHWIPVPALPLRLFLGEMSTLILDGQRVVPNRLLHETGFRFNYPNLQKALINLHPSK